MAFDIQAELKKLPDCPGVYIHKDKAGQIIYVGKAISLRRRVRQYFQSPKNQPEKVRKMVSHIDSFEYLSCASEVDALILECRLIKQYRPKYNILLRDDKSYPYIKLTVQDKYPVIVRTRRLLKDGARYFGPYPFVHIMDMVIELLNSRYRLKRCRQTEFPEGFKPCLNYHMGLCDAMCSTDVEDYGERIEKALAFLDGEDSEILEELSALMREASDKMNYEQAAAYRDYIEAVKEMQGMLRDPKRYNDPHIAALRQKQRAVGIKDGMIRIFGKELAEGIRRIESFDVSHVGGVDAVGAMVVFVNGHAEKKAYRRYRLHQGNNDFASMQELLARRLTGDDELPDLILMDGGRPQVNAALSVLGELDLDAVTVAGMVKDDRHRTSKLYYGGREIELKACRELYSYFGRIQDEVHRFAIAYHHGLRSKSMLRSELDSVPGIGEKRKIALLKAFGGIDAVKSATIEELAAVPGMTVKAAQNIKENLK